MGGGAEGKRDEDGCRAGRGWRWGVGDRVGRMEIVGVGRRGVSRRREA